LFCSPLTKFKANKEQIKIKTAAREDIEILVVCIFFGGGFKNNLFLYSFKN